MKTFWNVLLTISLLLTCMVAGAQSSSEWNKRGIDALKQERYEEAIRNFTQAIMGNPQNGDYFWNRGFAYHKKGMRYKDPDDFRASTKDFDRALPYYIRSQQKLARLYYTRGENYYRLDDLENAVLDFTNAIMVKAFVTKKYHMRRGEAYQELGEKYDQPKYYKNAIKDYSRVIANTAIKSKYAAVPLQKRAICYAHMKESYQAIRDMEEAIKLLPENAELQFHEARIYALLGNNQAAFESLRLAVNKGFRNYDLVKKHQSDFGSMRNLAAYQEIVGQFSVEEPQKQEVYGFTDELPPILTIEDISFSEKVLDATETAQLSLTIRNFGSGEAREVVVKLSSLLEELEFPYQTAVPVIASEGGLAKVNIDISSSYDLPSTEALLQIEVVEKKFGVKIPGKQLRFTTRELLKPELILAKFAVTENLSASPNNQIDLNEQIDVKFAIQNIGQGPAENLEISVANQQKGVMLLGAIDEQGRLVRKNPEFSALPSGKFQLITFRYFVNSEFAEPELQFEIKARERTDRFSLVTSKQVPINTELQEEGYIRQVADDDDFTQKEVSIETVPDLVVDIHQDIPEVYTSRTNTYALIIGNEDYTRYQPDLSNESNVLFARSDAQMFAVYSEKTLGIPRENITVVTDGIRSTMRREIARLAKKAQYGGEEVELIFYYSGHGFPDSESKESYLMPVDVRGSEVKEGIRLTDLYAELTEYPSAKVTVFLDACFSGGGRQQGLDPVKGIKIRPKKEALKGNLVVFSSSSGNQESLFYKKKKHGLFTYFLLKKFQETHGQVTYGELADFLARKVPLVSTDQQYKEQNPEVNTSNEVKDAWRNWSF